MSTSDGITDRMTIHEFGKENQKWDIEYIRKHFSKTVFRVFEDIGHGGLAALKPDLLASELERTIGE